ncbi:uncharacterized protein F5147DRAFT_767179 [Suillus discolor]|uniref:Uncharacterized protein n=1 Tax=Suillus discolor TaxID=1912936 RepID=A0A9P7FIM5_9AGAM|nr:uncharacterized protein F5147DRAFT_767179 [Suillus discolor]KAG2119708.1 hypothetical protein F5147DRAFT_767179 [Suillus discolor]
MHANSSKNEVSMLMKKNRALEQKVIIMLFSSSRYEQLLEHIGSLSIGTPTDPFTEILKVAHEANRQIPVYCEDNYDGVYYWFKSDWTKEYLSHGVLEVKCPDGAGSISYLVDEDGFVVSEAIQQKMRETLHILWFILLRFGCAPTSWTKIDILALEFVQLPQSITISPFIRHPKKKKEDHVKVVQPITVVNAIAKATRPKISGLTLVVETPDNNDKPP